MIPVKERFEAGVLMIPFSDCHYWDANISSAGYGRMYANGKMTSAHRLSYMLYKGEIPNGMHVLHSCDEPTCVNPSHLRLGTHADNMRDRSLREKCLTSLDQVKKIREELNSGIRQCVVAKKYGLSLKYIYRIKKNQIRMHV